MTEPTNLQGLAQRFAPQIEQLQALLARHVISSGSPEDVAPMAALVSVPGAFHDELASALRAIIDQERTRVNRVELLEVLSLAIGGPRIDGTAEDLHEPPGQLLVFVNVVLLSMRKQTSEGSMHIPPASNANSPRTLVRSASDAASAIAAEKTTASRLDAAWETTMAPTELKQAESPRPHPPESFVADEITPQRHIPPLPPAREELPAETLQRPKTEGRLLSRPASAVAGVALMLMAAGVFLTRKPLGHKPAPAALSATPPVVEPAGEPSPLPATATKTDAAQTADSSSYDANNRITRTAKRSVQSTTGVSAARAGDDVEFGQNGSAVDSAGAGHLSQSPAPQTSVAPELGDRKSPVDLKPSPGTSEGRAVHARGLLPSRHSSRGSLFSVSSGVMSANLVSAPAPEYPVLAKVAHVEGEVILQAVVSRTGAVVATHALEGHHLLRGAAEHAVQHWRYRPYLMDGRATDVETIVFVKFELHH